MGCSIAYRGNTLKTHYTKKQIQVAGWINSIGFQTELEYVVGKYCLDIYIPEINIGIEIDGPSHYSKKDAKRDDWIKENYKIQDIIRFKSSIGKEEFKKAFKDLIVRKFGNGNIEKGNS